MTAPDVRTAAQAEALERWPRQDISVMHDADLSNYLCRHGFEDGAVWGAALVTPTREQIAEALWGSPGNMISLARLNELAQCGEGDYLEARDYVYAQADAVVALISKGA